MNGARPAAGAEPIDLKPHTTVHPAAVNWHHAVSQFLFFEAELLDDRRLREWLDLIDDEISYEVRTRPTTDHDLDPGPPPLVFQDDKATLIARVKRLESGMAWAEVPPSRTRYLITNVRVTHHDDTLRVRCNFALYRNRLETTTHLLVGTRDDILRPVDSDAGFVVTRRFVTLDQNVVLATNLSMLF